MLNRLFNVVEAFLKNLFIPLNIIFINFQIFLDFVRELFLGHLARILVNYEILFCWLKRGILVRKFIFRAQVDIVETLSFLWIAGLGFLGGLFDFLVSYIDLENILEVLEFKLGSTLQVSKGIWG